MATIQVNLDPETSAKLAFVAALMNTRKADLAADCVREGVSRRFQAMGSSSSGTPPVGVQPRRARRGTRGQRVLYVGTHPNLQNGRVYGSFAEVLRFLDLPDLVGLLYDAKTHKGDKAENILKRHAPGVYEDLRRV